MTTIKLSAAERVFETLNIIFMFIIIIVMVFPFLTQIALALSGNLAVQAGRVTIWPVDFTLISFRTVIKDMRFINAFYNSVLYTLVSVALSLLFITLSAYPLSKKHLKGRGAIMNILVFSMMFGTGGLIPNYLLIRSLGLVDTYWSLWLPGMISIWYIIIMKSFFQQIPDSLIESAEIDGASQVRILFQIAMPLSLPSLAAIGLFVAVSAWNSYFNPMIYITSPEKRLLPIYLKDVLQNVIVPAGPEAERLQLELNEKVAPYSLRAATLMCATIPILLVYPFLQKYYVKGMMIGAIKG